MNLKSLFGLFATAMALSASIQAAEPVVDVTPAVQPVCELQSGPIVSKKLVGTYEVIASPPDSIVFSKETGDITGNKAKFNLDTLYEVDSDAGSARFRTGAEKFLQGSTFLGSLAWEDGKILNTPGSYRFYAVKTERKKSGKTITMVGDSITWWSYGRYFRCLLSQKVPDAQFTGPHTDTYGFGHAAEGGNNTKDIIFRLSKIKAANNYFVLIGTNDWPFATPERTAENVKLIAKLLSKKGGKVIISTLLPRLDGHDERNRKVNRMLLSWNGQGCNCQIIDLDREFRKLSNKKEYFWDTGLHPNIEGYKKIVEIIGPKIERAIQ